MKRPDQHITETKSQRIFERIVPVEWVFREIKPDYGVDYLVEIFENNLSTGKTFFVQLKGATQEIKNNVFEKQFTTDNLDYYNSLALPVMIICVSVTTEQIWGIWANKLIEQNVLKDNQKTVTISLNKDYLLNESTFSHIASQTEIVKKLGLFTETDSSLTQSFNQHILKWIENFYSKSVSVKFNNLPKNLSLKYTSEGNIVKTVIETSSFSKSIETSGLREDLPFLYRPKFDAEDINDFNKDILLSIAISLAKYDVHGSIGLLTKLIAKHKLNDQKEWIELDPLGLLILAKEQNEIPYFDNLVQEIIKHKHYDLFLFFDLAYFIIGTDELQELRLKNLKYVIEITSDNQTKGTCHYNLGNIQRSSIGNPDAISNYIKAARLYPDYKNRLYWWREIAGLFFLNSHYKWAEICYKKSLELSNQKKDQKFLRIERTEPGEINLVHALIADCLFIQGKFTEANFQFEKYFKLYNHSAQEWKLKNMVCLELMGSKLDNVNLDRVESTKLCEQGLSIDESKEITEIFTKATELDPTNGLAWFNLGVALDKEQKFEESLFAFLMAGLIQDGDKEAQFNALTIAFTQQKLELMQAILIYIGEKHGDLVINELSDYIMQKNIPLEAKKGLIKAFGEMMEITKTMHNKTYKQ